MGSADSAAEPGVIPNRKATEKSVAFLIYAYCLIKVSIISGEKQFVIDGRFFRKGMVEYGHIK